MSGAGGSPRERRRAEVSGAAVQSRGGRDSGRAAGPGPGGFVYVSAGGKGAGAGRALARGGRRCGALHPGDLPCLLGAGGRERCGWIMAGTSLLVWQEGQEARRGAPPPPPGSGGTRARRAGRSVLGEGAF